MVDLAKSWSVSILCDKARSCFRLANREALLTPIYQVVKVPSATRALKDIGVTHAIHLYAHGERNALYQRGIGYTARSNAEYFTLDRYIKYPGDQPAISIEGEGVLEQIVDDVIEEAKLFDLRESQERLAKFDSQYKRFPFPRRLSDSLQPHFYQSTVDIVERSRDIADKIALVEKGLEAGVDVDNRTNKAEFDALCGAREIADKVVDDVLEGDVSVIEATPRQSTIPWSTMGWR